LKISGAKSVSNYYRFLLSRSFGTVEMTLYLTQQTESYDSDKQKTTKVFES